MPKKGHQKLTEEQVIELRELRAKHKIRLADLAERFGIAYSTAGHICRGDEAGWKWVGGPITKRAKGPNGSGSKQIRERAALTKAKAEGKIEPTSRFDTSIIRAKRKYGTLNIR